MKSLRIFGIVFWVMLVCVSLLPANGNAQTRSTPVTVVDGAPYISAEFISIASGAVQASGSTITLATCLRNVLFTANCTVPTDQAISLRYLLFYPASSTGNTIMTIDVPMTFRYSADASTNVYEGMFQTTVAIPATATLTPTVRRSASANQVDCRVDFLAEACP